MEDQDLWKLFDTVLREIPLPYYEAIILFLQIIAWLKLSQEGRIPEGLRFDSYYRSRDVSFESLSKYFSDLYGKYPAFDPSYLSHPHSLHKKFLQILLNSVAFYSLKAHHDGKDDFEQALNKAYDRMSRDVNLCPPELSDLISSFVEGESIYNPFPGAYDLAYHLAKRTGRRIFTEGTPKTPLPYLINILADTTIQPEFSDPLFYPKFTENEHILRKFDEVVCVLPFSIANLIRIPSPDQNLRISNQMLPVAHDSAHYSLTSTSMVDPQQDIFNRFRFSRTITKDPEVAILEHILAQTSEKAVVLIENRFLSRTVSIEREFKAYLIRNGIIKAIIALPDNMFMEGRFSVSIIILEPRGGNESVLFIDASPRYRRDHKTRKNILIGLDEITDIYRTRAEREEISKVAHIDERYKENFNLIASQYVLDEAIKQALSKIDTIPLSKITKDKPIRPQNIMDEEVGDLFKEVSAQDILKAGFISEPSKEKYIMEKKHLAEKYKLLPYDILLSVIGTVGKVGIVPKDPGENWIAGQNLQIIRLPDKELAIAVYMFLKSDVGQAIIKQHIIGGTIPRIQAEALNAIPIPVLSIEQVKTKVEDFYREIELYDRISKLEKEIAELHKWELPKRNTG